LDNFTQDSKNVYAKLDPTKLKSTKVNEIDGDLGAENEKDKKSPKDFALWKKAKVNEPNWDSPWGKGRPGWHIECSVLCTQMFGNSLDIHCGGCDLKFPHHDNEIAQSEAYFNSEQWVNYFMHTGHLHIEGSKMSKSLKNFIKIEEILNEGFNSNTIRIQFVKHKWDTDMDYNREGLRSSFDEDKKMSEFFFNLNAKLRIANTKTVMKFNEEDHKISKLLIDTKEKIHSSLIDNLNTEKVMILLKELMNSYNIYETKNKGDLYKVQIPNPKPQTPNPKPQTPNPKPLTILLNVYDVSIAEVKLYLQNSR
jgi:cysteinyl-tRNA synthetase